LVRRGFARIAMAGREEESEKEKRKRRERVSE